MKTVKQLAFGLVFISLLIAGCKSLTRSQKGGAIGAAGGGVIGGVIGKALGNTAAGVIVGATVGGVTGAVIGRKMDKQAEEMQKVLGDAEVKRVGEGIVIEFKDKVLFGYDRSDLGTSARTNLSRLSEILQKYPDTNIEVLGHTDSKGRDDYNQALSERRAAATAAYLKSQGIQANRVTTRGLGETDPKGPNDTDAGRAENRRVEFVVTANQKMVNEAKEGS
jgi:outer membrane protein OmpA-like peptidoglycan-associated protein